MFNAQNSVCNFIWHATVVCVLVPLTWHCRDALPAHACHKHTVCLTHKTYGDIYAHTLHYTHNCTSQI